MSVSEDEIHPELPPDAPGEVDEPNVADPEGPRSALARGLPEWDLLPPDAPLPRPAPAA